MKLWLWFIVPAFGVKALTLFQAWGISLFAGFLAKQHSISGCKDERDADEKIAYGIGVFLYPWIVLAGAWIVKSLLF
jgi:hypothetical protein